MSSVNQKTLLTYETHYQAYIDNTTPEVTGGLKDWIDQALEGLPLDAKIMEIGSGDGRDARYIESLGYDVECTDATQAFVNILLEKGFNAHVHNAILDPIIGSFDLIFANSVLVHFTREETILVTSKVQTALNPNGRFAFSVKLGRGDLWTNAKVDAPRYYHFWTRKRIDMLLRNTGFSHWTISEDASGRGGSDDWLQVIAYK